MTVESASYISQLDTTLPTAADLISEGDDHLRLTKTVLKTQFPNFGTTAIAASAAEVNYSVGVTSSIQTQINGKGAITGQAWTGAHSFAGATSVPTLAAGSNTTGAASTAFVQADFLQKFPNYTAPVNASTTELNYLVGLTGAIQPQLSNQVSGPINAAISKTTPVDADELGLSDSAASWGLKKLTFANLKAWMSGLYVGKTGAQTMTGDLTVPSLNGGQLAGLRNKIINGVFDVWQRGASRSVGTGASTAYVADRWMGVRSGFASGATVSQQPAGLTGFRYCARVQRDSGNADAADVNLEQDLETSACIPFQGAAVTLSFYARCGANYSAASSALTVRLVSGTGTDQNALVGTFTGIANAVNSTATLTTTWQRFSYTVTIGAGVTQLGARFIHSPTGTAGVADYFEITGVQLEISSVATPFEHRPYGMELALCQRYYYRLSGDVKPAGAGFYNTTTNLQGLCGFPVPMRAAPTALEQSGTPSHYDVSGVPCSVVPTIGSTVSESGALLNFGIGSATTTGYAGQARIVNAAGYLGFSAEL